MQSAHAPVCRHAHDCCCRVFEAAESGDVDELSELTGRLAELAVSIDTRVRWRGQEAGLQW